ncbi:hypothetical protein B5X24_HaOG207762 [Helicoverpa armigera]|nr:hypothetical protein B5X24_HaOG207762 [Helicoverpa armigera]
MKLRYFSPRQTLYVWYVTLFDMPAAKRRSCLTKIPYKAFRFGDMSHEQSHRGAVCNCLKLPPGLDKTGSFNF